MGLAVNASVMYYDEGMTVSTGLNKNQHLNLKPDINTLIMELEFIRLIEDHQILY